MAKSKSNTKGESPTKAQRVNTGAKHRKNPQSPLALILMNKGAYVNFHKLTETNRPSRKR